MPMVLRAPKLSYLVIGLVIPSACKTACLTTAFLNWQTGMNIWNSLQYEPDRNHDVEYIGFLAHYLERHTTGGARVTYTVWWNGEGEQTYSRTPSLATLQRTDMAPTRLPMSPSALRLLACAALVACWRPPALAATPAMFSGKHYSSAIASHIDIDRPRPLP